MELQEQRGHVRMTRHGGHGVAVDQLHAQAVVCKDVFLVCATYVNIPHMNGELALTLTKDVLARQEAQHAA